MFRVAEFTPPGISCAAFACSASPDWAAGVALSRGCMALLREGHQGWEGSGRGKGADEGQGVWGRGREVWGRVRQYGEGSGGLPGGRPVRIRAWVIQAEQLKGIAVDDALRSEERRVGIRWR